jgi:ATP-dependent RNA helicase DeaD
VLLATLAERRKAERLLGNARLPFTWTAAPSARDITRAAEDALATELVEAARRADAPEAGDARELAARLGADVGRDALLATLLGRELARLPAGEPLSEVDLRRAPPTKPGPRPAPLDFARSAALFEVNLGKSQKAEPGWLLPLICRRGGVTRREVGAIRVGPQASQFEIASEAADDFALAAGESDPRAPHVHIRRLDVGPDRHRAGRDVHAAAGPERQHVSRGERAASPGGHGAWRPPARRPPPGPRKAGSRRPPRHR